MLSKGSRGRAFFGGLRSNLGSDFQRDRIRKEIVCKNVYGVKGLSCSSLFWWLEVKSRVWFSERSYKKKSSLKKCIWFQRALVVELVLVV